MTTCKWKSRYISKHGSRGTATCWDTHIVGNTGYCFEHGGLALGEMYMDRQARAAELRELDTEIADLESALETR